MKVGTYSEKSRSRADSRWNLTLGPTSVFHPSSSGFLCINPDPRVTLQMAWIVTLFQNLYLYHITNHTVLDQSKVCLSVTPFHMQPIRIPEVTGTALDRPEPLRLHPQLWVNQKLGGYIPSPGSTRTPEVTSPVLSQPEPRRLHPQPRVNQNPWSYMHSIRSTRTPQVMCTALGQPGPWRLHCWINQLNWVCLWAAQRIPAHIPGEFSFPLVELEDSWELGKGDMEAYVENIKSVTSAVRGRSRAR